MLVLSLGLEVPLEEGMTTHSSILAWKIPRTEEPGGLQSVESRVDDSLCCTIETLPTLSLYSNKN